MRSQLFDAFSEASATAVSIDGLSPARSVVGRIADYISVGPGGEPLLLISCQGGPLQHRPPLGLQHLRVEYGVRYRVRASTEVIENVFTIVSLRGDGRDLFESFCLAGEVLLGLLPKEPLVADVDHVVNQLVEMLAALVLPSQRTVAGLWAELWLISNAVEREAALAAWHSEPTDRFDFAFAGHFFEVKATEGVERMHEFAYDQLRNTDRPICIASLKLRRAQNGISISDLVDVIQSGLKPQLREKLVRNVFGAVGDAVSRADEIRFDVDFAASNMRLVVAEHVPAVFIPSGSPISGVRFRVNFDDSSMVAFLQTRSPAVALIFR